MSKGIVLKPNARPTVLYKYRSLSPNSREHTLRLLSNSDVYFASPAELNDPFECQARITMKDKVEGIEGDDDPLFLEKNREGMRRQLRVLSLTAKNDDALMWSHYADSHRGICVGFDASTDKEWFGLAEPVKYDADLPIIEYEVHGDGKSLYSAMLTKSAQWSYEQEWRICDYAPERERKFPANLLIEIILGCEISPRDRLAVLARALARPNPVRVYQAERDLLSYSITLRLLGAYDCSVLRD